MFLNSAGKFKEITIDFEFLITILTDKKVKGYSFFQTRANCVAFNKNPDQILYTGLFSTCVIFALLDLKMVSSRLEFAQTKLRLKRDKLRD